jgi:hypothetical protein
MKEIFLLLIISTLLFSCKKDGKKDMNGKTTYDLLINKKWKINNKTGYFDGIDSVGNYATWPDYSKDDYICFYDNQTYEQNAGKLLNPFYAKQIMDQGTWQLTSNNQVINCVSQLAGIDDYQLKIVEITETKLSVEYNFSGENYKITDSFIVIP